MEPGLASLLGLEDGSTGDRQDLFAAWRLLFERLADTGPTVLAFEDMHWADAGLLDFVEYLLESSRDYPLFVITLARPELQERRPGWGAAQRNFTSLYLEPLANDVMGELLDGLAPGLPARLHDQILARAEGVPLYAVETVRMLLDRGLLVRDGTVYRPTGEVETLEVPETLHALIAARLDGVSPDERRVLQDGAVLGKTFTKAALSALSELSEADLVPLLTSLARKEVLGVQSDPRSPEHGQYGFLQDLVRHVAYETLAKSERKIPAPGRPPTSRASSPTKTTSPKCSPPLPRGRRGRTGRGRCRQIRAKAREMLARAGERARSLGAPDEGQRYFDAGRGTGRRSSRPGAVARAQRTARNRREPAGRGTGATRAGDHAVRARRRHALGCAGERRPRRRRRYRWTPGRGSRPPRAGRCRAHEDEADAALAGALAQLGRMHVLAGRRTPA